MQVEVTPAGPSDSAEVVRILVSAFAHDPITCWLLGKRSTRVRARTSLFRYPVSQLLRDGVVETAGRDAVALWAPPGFGTQDEWQLLLRSIGAFSATLRATRSNITKAIKLHETVQQHRPREPHWYLSMIGTTPQARGQGRAAALLTARLKDADLAHAPAYLESSNEENLPLYRRHGFQVIEQLRIEDSPPLWSMYRVAR